MTRTAYIARPIDHATPNHNMRLIQHTVEQIKQIASKTTAAPILYDPAAAFTVNRETTPDGTITQINHTALRHADQVIALWAPDTPSYGVPNEIGLAVAAGTPVDLITPAPNTGWASHQPGVTHHRIWNNHDDNHEMIWDILNRHPQKNHQQPYRGLNFKNADQHRPAAPELPTRGHHDDAGLDLYVSERTEVPPGEFRDIPTNLAVELPVGTWGYLTGRSSTLRKRQLLVNPGVIDAGYRGELFSGVWNLGDNPATVETGDRIAQLILLPNLTKDYRPDYVDQFDTTTTRGHNGFGSTG